MSFVRKTPKYLAALAGISMVAFGLSRVANVSAQSSSSAPSGTFTCLINANYSGYLTKAANTSEQAVNALLVINFSTATPNTGTLVGLVVNNVNNFESTSANTQTATSTTQPVNFTLTQVTPATNVYRMVSDTPGDNPYYIAMVNNGNSMFIMASPSNDKTHNGACQKV